MHSALSENFITLAGNKLNCCMENWHEHGTSTPRLCFMPVHSMRFHCNAPCQFTALPNLHSLIFSLTIFHWFICIISDYFFLWEYHFWFTPFWLTPAFSGTQLACKTRTWCIHKKTHTNPCSRMKEICLWSHTEILNSRKDGLGFSPPLNAFREGTCTHSSDQTSNHLKTQIWNFSLHQSCI